LDDATPCYTFTTVQWSIIVAPNPKADFDILPPVLMQPSDTFFLQNKSVGAISYLWYAMPNQFLDTTLHILSSRKEIGEYCFMLIAKNSIGCLDTTTKCLKVIPDTTKQYVWVPNAFSPNDDNINDNLVLWHNNASLLLFSIYDRWGECVFTTTDWNKQWDGTYKGKRMDVGTYFYVLKYRFNSGEEKQQQGDISLLK
jgi:gliding motility-associated-like protein